MDCSKTMESSDDILTEILLRLPSKSIFKFTCVSTRWNNLIMDPCFSELYSERTRRSLGSSYPRGRLLGLVQCNTKYGNIIPYPDRARHSFVSVRSEEYFVGKKIRGTVLFSRKRGYFITSSKDGLFLSGIIPHKYYVGNPITGEWEPLPPPPPPQFFPHRALSVGLASYEEEDVVRGNVINFRVVIATGCDGHHEITGTKVIPIETYSSRTREWRKSKLVSEILVAIHNAMPPTVSGGFFHWFTATRRYVVAYDSSSLDEEDNDDRRLVPKGEKKKKKKKQHVVQVIKVPNSIGSQIIWRSDNGQTMWFGTSNLRDGVVVYRKRDDSDDWTLINKVECLNTMRNDIIGITEKDIKIDMEIIQNASRDNDIDLKMSRDMVWMIAFIPWDPRLIIVRIWERFFIYDCVKQRMDREVQLFGNPYFTDHVWEWYPYFHSLSNSPYNFRHHRQPC